MVATLTDYRRALAALLGEVEVGTADAGPATTVIGVATALASGARVRSTVLPASLFRGKWLHRPDATNANDRDRLIATYDPIAGYLYPDEPWSVSPGGEVFEILGLFSGSDLNGLVNEGLKRCFLVVEVTFATASNQDTRHDLSSVAPWLTVPEWVYQVGELAPGETRARTDPFRRVRRGTVARDGAALYLEGPSFPTTSTVYVRAIKPAYHHCAAAATPTAFAQDGLLAEDDVAVADPTWVAWAAVLAAADRLDHLERTGQASQEALRARQMAASRFGLHARERFVPPRRTLVPLTFVGPALSGRRWGRRF